MMKEKRDINSFSGEVKRKSKTFASVSLFLVFFLCNPSVGWGEASGLEEARQSDLLKGKMIYSASCTLCHGSRGEGDGPAAVFIGPYSHPRPNDFTRGVFKFRSTESGELPKLSDLMRTIAYGVPGYMPSFKHLGEDGLRQVALYVASEFIEDELPSESAREPFEEAGLTPGNSVPETSRPIPSGTENGRLELYKGITSLLNNIATNSVTTVSQNENPEPTLSLYKEIITVLNNMVEVSKRNTPVRDVEITADQNAQPEPINIYSRKNESISRGKKVFHEMQCVACHGIDGRGAKTNMKDERGLPVMAANLTKPESFGNGNTPEDIYRTIMTGLNGTPMPSFSDLFEGEEERAWDLVAYIGSLADKYPETP